MAGVEDWEALVGLRRLTAGECEVTEREGRFLGFGNGAEAGYGGDVAGERYVGDAILTVQGIPWSFVTEGVLLLPIAQSRSEVQPVSSQLRYIAKLACHAADSETPCLT